jgi:hypothetical protein
MYHQTELHLLTLAGIAHRCAQETERFFQRQRYDPGYCFELFRRAIMHHNQRAWELVYAQYRLLVTGWVERNPAFPDSGEETLYFINRAFEKMWVALTPKKFDNFPDLKSLLRYLQMCVHSVILDHVRVAKQPIVDPQADVSVVRNPEQAPFVEDEALDQVQRQEFWKEINARLHNEKERLVVNGSFVLGLKPRELYVRFAETFDDVKEIYRVKENVLARLRRDSDLGKLFGSDA